MAGRCSNGRLPVNEGFGPRYSANGYLDFEPFVGAVKARHPGDDVRNGVGFGLHAGVALVIGPRITLSR